MREPDQIDMMEEWELRAELRIVVQKLREAQERCERLEAALKELHALVTGECPGLLDEDSGGCSKTAMMVYDALDTKAMQEGKV